MYIVTSIVLRTTVPFSGQLYFNSGWRWMSKLCHTGLESKYSSWIEVIKDFCAIHIYLCLLYLKWNFNKGEKAGNQSPLVWINQFSIQQHRVIIYFKIIFRYFILYIETRIVQPLYIFNWFFYGRFLLKWNHIVII